MRIRWSLFKEESDAQITCFILPHKRLELYFLEKVKQSDMSPGGYRPPEDGFQYWRWRELCTLCTETTPPSTTRLLLFNQEGGREESDQAKKNKGTDIGSSTTQQLGHTTAKLTVTKSNSYTLRLFKQLVSPLFLYMKKQWRIVNIWENPWHKIFKKQKQQMEKISSEKTDYAKLSY